MKILAIRGAGLASLAEPFELDLGSGPLASVGIFAIVGPTGAGKSTLLDALFLGLFGRTPRLAAQPRARLGAEDDEDAWTSRDPRSLARTDASVAYAEVDFSGIDGRPYRARWETRRKNARGRETGPTRGASSAFRRPEHALLALPRLGAGGDDPETRRVGGTKTEVLGHIALRLGLDFDQFRRSVVLAQGEIAAFLHAPDRDRAELLERMTGTEIYGALSQEIHRQTQRQRDLVALRSDALARVEVLAPDARRSAADALAHARAQTSRAADELKASEARLAAEALLRGLAEDEAAAAAELLRLDAALTHLAHERPAVQEYQRLATVRPLLLVEERIETARRDLERRVEACAASERAAEAAVLGQREGVASRSAALGARKAEAATAETLLVDAARALAEAAPRAALSGQRIAEAEALGRELERAEHEREGLAAEAAASEDAIASWARRRERAPELEAVLDRAGLDRASSPRGPEVPGGRNDAAEDLAARAAHVSARLEALERGAAEAQDEVVRLTDHLSRVERSEREATGALQACEARTRRASAALQETLRGIDALTSASPDAAADGGEAQPGAVHGARGARAPFLARTSARVARDREHGGHALVGEVARERPSQFAVDGLAVEGLARARTSGPALLVGAPSASAHPGLARDAQPLLQSASRARSWLASEEGRLSAALARVAARRETWDRERARREREAGSMRLELSRFAAELTRLDQELESAHAATQAAETLAEQALAGQDLEGPRRAAIIAHLRTGLVVGEPCEVCGAAVTHAPRSPDGPEQDAHFRPLKASEASPSLIALHAARATETELRARRASIDSVYRALAGGGAAPAAAGAAAAPPAGLEADLLAARFARVSVLADELEQDRAELMDALTVLGQRERQCFDAGRTRDAARLHQGEAQARRLEADRERAALAGEQVRLGLDVLVRIAHREMGGGPLDLLSFVRELAKARSAARAEEARLPLIRRLLEEATERAARLSVRTFSAREQAAEAAEHVALHARHRAAHDAARAEAARARGLAELAQTESDAARAALAAAERVASERAAERRRIEEDLARTKRERAQLLSELHALLHGALLDRLVPDGPLLDGARSDEAETEPLLARVREILARPVHAVEAIARELDDLDQQRRVAEALLEERRRRLAEGASALDAPRDREGIERVIAASEARAAAARGELERCRQLLSNAENELAIDDRALRERAALEAGLLAEERELRVLLEVNAAFGSADGKKLRVYAQRLTLRALVSEASRHLSQLSPRYALGLVPGADLAIQITDRALAGEVRAVGALSGGETFLVALALALALAGMAASRVRIGTFFIDEGFGSLDAASLDVVLSALDALEATGRQIGIVSHVPDVRERFPLRVEVVPDASGKSTVQLVEL